MLKIVTILFVDVVGSTRRSEAMHPEDTRALMTDFFRAMSEEIKREGGTVERIIGDGIMADFGVPTAHEDDPLRAVKAARAMLERLERWNADKDPSHQIEIRVGINTGEVSAAGDPGQDLLITGDPVNVAARLEQSASPGEILIGSRTARTVRRAFRVRQLEPLMLKGKSEPVDCYVVEEPLNGLDEDHTWREAPLVGREMELTALLDAYDRCCLTRTPHLLTIMGDAGVGKSRLVKELVGKLAERATVLIGRCIPYGTGVTLWPLREILEDISGVLDTDPAERAIARIENLVEKVISPLPVGAPQIAAALASTIGLESPEGPSFDPRTRHREMVVAWRHLLSNLAEAQPAVMIIQDIHWADDLMLDVIDDLASHTSGPLLIVCPTRSEVLKGRPTWGAGVPNSMTIQLEPLTEAESSHLIDSVLRSNSLPQAIKELVLTRSEGNPFFVQEVLRHLIDQGALKQDGSQWRADGEANALEIPDHVQGVLLARLDLLSEEERVVAQRAAVIGRVFWEGALETLDGSPGQTKIIRELERRNFITERTSSSFAGQIEYAFTHVLVRDVAYQTMPRKQRGQTHRAVAEWIEQTSGERIHELSELLAHHLDQANDLIPSDEIRLRARSFSLISSRNALQRFAIGQATALGKRAIELSLPGREKLESLEAFGDVSLVAYAIDDAWEAYTLGVTEALTLGDPSLVAQVAAKAAIAATRFEGAMKSPPPPEQVGEIIDVGLQNVSEGDDRSRCLLLASLAFGGRATHASSLPDIESAPTRALELAEEVNDPELLSVALDAAAFWVAPEARYGEMYRLQTRRVGLIPLLRDVTEACDCLGSACWVSYLAGHYEESIRFADECLKRADGVDAGNYEYALQWRVIARFTVGDWDGALEDQAALESMIEKEENGSIPVFLGGAYAYTLLCHELRGDEEKVGVYLARLRELRTVLGEDIGLPRSPTAMVLLHRGLLEEARSWLTLEVNFSLGPILEAMCALAAEDADHAAGMALAEMVRNDVKRMESPSLQHHVERLEGRLLEASDRCRDAALRFESSATGFASLGVPWEEAASRLLMGKAHVRDQQMAKAEQELNRALEIFSRLGSRAEVDRATSALENL